MAQEAKKRPAAEAEVPPMIRGEGVGPVARPAQQGRSPGLPPIPTVTGAAASSSIADAVRWPRVQTEDGLREELR